MGQVLFILGNALALFASWRMTRWLFPASPVLERALTTCAGVPLLVLPVLTLLGATGGLRMAPVLGVLGLVAAAIAWLSWRGQRAAALSSAPPAAALSSAPPAAAPASAPPAPEPSVLQRWADLPRAEYLTLWAVLGLLGAQAFAILVQLAVRGTRLTVDDLSYHAPMAGHWIQAGRLVLAPYNYHAYYPGGGELFATWFVLPTWLDVYASLAGVYWLVLSVLAVARLSMSFDAGALATALSGTLVLACAPFVAQASTFAAVDLAGSALCGAALALALCASDRDSATTARARIAFVGGLSGLAIGCKVTYAPIVPALLLWFVWARRPRPREALGWLGLFAACAVPSGGYWYARNIALTGNPLFPARVLFFDGPLDEKARKLTSLWYQLTHIAQPELAKAVAALLDWPRPMAWLVLAAYAVTLLFLMLSWLRRSAWRELAVQRIALVVVVSLVELAVIVAGPFSGTANAEGAQLLVRLRFFLMFVLLGAPLVAYWVGRARRLRPVIALALAVLAGVSAAIDLLPVAAGVGLGIAIGLLSLKRASFAPAPSRLGRALLLASFVAVPAIATAAMHEKAPLNAALARKYLPSWDAVNDLPRGARLTWYAKTAEYNSNYYRAFGPGLAYVPIKASTSGHPAEYPHQTWQKSGHNWWQDPAPKRKRSSFQRLVRNLQEQQIQYVVVLKPSAAAEWPPQYSALRNSKGVKAYKKRAAYAVFKIPAPRAK